MVTKNEKNTILERCTNKEEKIFISKLLDKVAKYEIDNKIRFTNFLNMSELSFATKVLDELKISYYIFPLNEFCCRKAIFFIPEYICDVDTFINEYIAVLKIKTNVKNKLLHKDYMGSLYSLGIKNDTIGDIVAYESFAYVFCLKSISEYIKNNLFRVGRQEVNIVEYELNDKEIQNISFELARIECIVASNRVDGIISETFGISRSIAKEKIVSGDLYVNDKNIITPSYNLVENDIVSIRKLGKIKIGEELRNTRSGKKAIVIYKFV